MRPNIRKVQPIESNDFDQQLWPVNLALLMLCGCVVGMNWAVSDFHTDIWYENGYVRLATLLGSVCGLAGLAMWLGGRKGRRLQMAALLSVSLHLVLGLVLLLTHVDHSEWAVGPRVPLVKRELREIDTLPDYQMTGLTPVLPANSDLEKPVESGLPANMHDRPLAEIVRNQQPAHPKPAAPAPSPAGLDDGQPQAKLAPVAAAAKPRPFESAAPRRGDLASTLTTRQPAPADASPIAAAITAPPTADALATPTGSTIEAQATPLGHQLLDPSVPRRPENDLVALLPQVAQPGGPRAEAAPRTNEREPSATIAVGPALVKTMTEPAAVARGDAPAPAAPARHEQTAEQGAPRPATGAGRQAIAGSVASRLPAAESASPAPIAPLIVAMASPVRPEAVSAKPDIPNAGLVSSIRDPHVAGPVADLSPAGPIGPVQAPPVVERGQGSGPLQAAATQFSRSAAAVSPVRPAGPELSGPAGSGGFGVAVAMAGAAPGRDRPTGGPIANPTVPGIGALGNTPLGTAGLGSPALSVAIAGLPAAAPPGGVDPIGSIGPVPESRATGAMRATPGSGIPGGAALAGGASPSDGPGGLVCSGGAMQVAAVQIGRPGAGNTDLPGGITGGIPGGIGTGIGLPGLPTAGGLTAEVKAELPQLPPGGGPGGNGSGQGSKGSGAGTAIGSAAEPIDTQLAGVSRQAGGLPGAIGTGAGGSSDAASGALLSGAPGVLLSGLGAPAAGVPGNGSGGPLPTGTGAGALLPRNGAVGLPNGTGVAADAPKFAGSPSSAGPGNSASGAASGAGGNGPGGPGGPEAIGPGGDGSGHRFGSASLPTQMGLSDATGLAGGTGLTIAPQFGVPDRRARPDSDRIAMSVGRFLPRSGLGDGGPAVASLPVRAPTASFGGRKIGPGGNGPGGNGTGGNGPGGNKIAGDGPDGKTEETIERGLVYLAHLQADDGHWSLDHFPVASDSDAGTIRSDTAATGLALLSFFGAGYDHYDDKYRNVVRRGLEFLLKHQKDNGDLYIRMDDVSNQSAWLYSHAIASIALCEALGMTGDPKLREPAQKSIDFIMASQNPKLGGWRYIPRSESDTSVTGWQTTALKSGDLAGLKVPKPCYDRVTRWLDSAEVVPEDASRYIYNAENRASQDDRDSSRPTMTAVALLMRMYLGAKRDDAALLRGADFVKDNLPKDTDLFSRDTYYWYYATQVMFQLRGEYWKAWSERLHPLLVNSQVLVGDLAGSWDPQGAVPDRWGKLGGRVYVTTMNLLSLEVYYRHLPIYEVRP